MGGGTGTGAAPEIAKIAKENGSLTVGIITKPFKFEGPVRMKRALEGIKELKNNCDTLLVIPNEVLLDIIDPNTTVNESFKLADSVLKQAAKGISELINNPGNINTDFADVKATMFNMGDALMGTGVAIGEERAILAAQQAINSPLLQDSSIKGAKNLLLHISGPKDMKMNEMVEAANIIYEEAGEDANVIFGCVTDERLNDNQEIHVTVVATGINSEDKEEQASFYKNYTKSNDYFDKNNDVNEQINNEPNLTSNEKAVDDIITDKIEQNNEESLKLERDDNVTDNQQTDNMFTFGEEDLEVPTFLRNNN